jgi:hypothetical protein
MENTQVAAGVPGGSMFTGGGRITTINQWLPHGQRVAES